MTCDGPTDVTNESYGRSPGVAALPLIRQINKLPEAERVSAAAAFVRSRLREEGE